MVRVLHPSPYCARNEVITRLTRRHRAAYLQGVKPPIDWLDDPELLGGDEQWGTAGTLAEILKGTPVDTSSMKPLFALAPWKGVSRSLHCHYRCIRLPLTIASLPGRLDPVPGRITSGVLLFQPHGLFRPQDLAIYRPAEDCRLD
jgi:hypothetical protein